MEKKGFTPNPQITKFANNRSLMDIQDNVNDQYANAKGEMIYSNKVIIVVNDYQGVKEGKHKEKFASYYLDVEDALFLAHHVINGTFKTDVVNVHRNVPHPGVFMVYGGKKVSRVLSIKLQEEKNRYEVKVGLYQPIVGANGQTSPDWKTKVDEHVTYPSVDHFRKMMHMLQTYIQSAFTVRLLQPAGQAPSIPAFTPSSPSQKTPEPISSQEPVGEPIFDFKDDDLPF